MARARYQFGIRRLFILTFTVAVMLTVAVNLSSYKIGQALIGTYFLILTVWIVMRGPYVYTELKKLEQRRHELEQQRSELK